MGIVSKIIRKVAVKTSITKKAFKVAAPNLKAAFNFKTGKTVRNLLPLLNDVDSLAYHVASKANKRGLRQANKITRAGLKTGVALVAVGSAGQAVNAFKKADLARKDRAAKNAASSRRKLPDGYKMVFGRLVRVNN